MSIDSNLKMNMEIVKLEPDALLDLYTLDTSTVVKDPYFNFQGIVYHFHPYHIRPEDSNAVLQSDRDRGVLEYGGVKYQYFPVSAEGFEILGDGSFPRPTLTISNVLPIVKDLTLNLGDLVGATFKRKRTFRKFLDNQGATSDSAAFWEEESYIISRKKIENKIVITFEMVTIAEANNIDIPKRRLLQNFCPWRYRGDGCGFARAKIVGLNNVDYGIADNFDNDQSLPDPVPWVEDSNYAAGVVVYHTIGGVRHYSLCKTAHTSSYVNRFSKEYWIADECSKTLSACKIRWTSSSDPSPVLPFGGFPCANRRIV